MAPAHYQGIALFREMKDSMHAGDNLKPSVYSGANITMVTKLYIDSPAFNILKKAKMWIKRW